MTGAEDIELLADRIDKVACHKCGATVDVRSAPPFSRTACPACHAELPVPALLGSFVLLERLGRGAMGAVYRAFDRSLKRNVAIKVMLKELGDDPHFVESFMREARALAALNHIHVAQVYTCGKEKGQPYIVMELVPGGRLDLLMEQGRRLGEARVLEIGLDVAKGLKAAHDIGLIHGDIKPQNILLDRKGSAKVVDFGLARFAGGKHRPTEVWGTPYYIAPEKARKEREDLRADIYSLGATMFHALVARPPFDGETARDVVLARLKEPAPSLAEFDPNLHPSTVALVARMLEADPAKRYPTYASLLPDMAHALEAVRSGAVKPAVHRPVRRRRAWVRPAVIASVVALTLAGMGFGLFLYLKDRKRPEAEPAPPARKGAVVMKFRDGKLVPVAVEEERAPSPPPAEPAPAEPPAVPAESQAPAEGGGPAGSAPAAEGEEPPEEGAPGGGQGPNP